MIVEILLKSLIKVALKSEINNADSFMRAEEVIREMRTVTLGLPRQVGKTSALIDLYQSAPSMFITNGSPMRRHLKERGIHAHTLDELQQFSHGKRLEVQYPLHYMLLDECVNIDNEKRNHVFDVAADLWRRGQVDKERFIVVIVGT